MFANRGLRFRVLAWVGAYALLLSVAVVTQGYVVNERAEELVWRSLLDAELDHFLDRKSADPTYRWMSVSGLNLYGPDSTVTIPNPLRWLPEGVHDELVMDGHEYVALVRGVDGQRHVLTLEITDLERRENALIFLMVGSTLAAVLAIGVVIAWGLGRVVLPLSTLAADIGKLKPDRTGRRVSVNSKGGSELLTISAALNDFLQRNEQFVERERAFIDNASHELRTPIAVISNSVQLAVEHPELPHSVQMHLARIDEAARGAEDLIALLLVLAKDPRQISNRSDRIALHELLPQIVEDHLHLTAGKNLRITLHADTACHVDAPLAVVQATVGNLLRNAIEHSDLGEIVVRLQPGPTVVIEDPGHAMHPEDVAALYANAARAGYSRRQGIGLMLIARLCEHLGWELRIAARQPSGTITALRLAR